MPQFACAENSSSGGCLGAYRPTGVAALAAVCRAVRAAASSAVRCRGGGRCSRAEQQKQLAVMLGEECCLFDARELRDLLERWLQEHPCGKAPKAELIAFVGTEFGASGGDTSEVMAKVVDIIDIDGDGAIDFREVVAGLSTFLRGRPEAKIELLFSALDMDGDGKVSRAELQHALRARLGQWIQSLGEESLSVVADRILAAGDLDGDGELCLAELLALVEAQPELRLRSSASRAVQRFNNPGASWSERREALGALANVEGARSGCSRESAEEEVAVQVLLSTPGLSPVAIGEFLGAGAGNVKVVAAAAFPSTCARLFFEALDLRGVTLDEALRRVSRRLCLPREAQQIDRLVCTFALAYCEGNPVTFVDSDAAYLTAFAVVMLNADAHSANVRQKMTREEFVRSVPRVERSALEGIYDRITAEEITLGAADALTGSAGLAPRLTQLCWMELNKTLAALGGS